MISRFCGSISMAMRIRATLILLLASVAPVHAHAQQAPSAEDVARVERKIEELRRMRQDMQRQIGTLQSQMSEFDGQIDALQNELRPGQSAPQSASTGQPAASGQTAAAG